MTCAGCIARQIGAYTSKALAVFTPVRDLVACQQQRAQQRERCSIRRWLDTRELVAAEMQLLQHGLMRL